ncbi:unnamed protein product, partial [Brenthis ino]
MRSRIFAERNIKYKEAVDLALALEAAEKHAEVSGATAVPTSASGAGGEASEGLFQSSVGLKSARPVSGAGRARVREAAELINKNPVYVPLALRKRVDSELERLEREGYTYRVDHWAYVRAAPPKAILHPCKFPLHPWQRIQADFAEYARKKYFIMIDAHSKWVEVFIMSRTDAEATIAVLRTTFARFGHPSQLVTDNGPPFSSLDFKNYCLVNCIIHVSTAPYRPQGNGAAENAIKLIKKIIKRAVFLKEDISMAINKFLFQYRNCEHSTTGVSPAVALLGHRLRGRLDAIRPDRAVIAREAQNRQLENKKGTNRLIEVGDTVLARDYRTSSNKWSEGVVTDKTGPSSYKVDVGEVLKWRRHQDQIINVDN